MPTGVYLVESLTECGVLLLYLEAVTCHVRGLDTLLKHFMDTRYSCPVKSTQYGNSLHLDILHCIEKCNNMSSRQWKHA